jgi:hypothetical protein
MTDLHSQSSLRRAENEVVFKSHNLAIEGNLRGLLDAELKNEMLIGFICECANEKCQNKIEMPLAEFTILRKNELQFITVIGHEQKDVERVVEKRDNYQIVEKFVAPPSFTKP